MASARPNLHSLASRVPYLNRVRERKIFDQISCAVEWNQLTLFFLVFRARWMWNVWKESGAHLSGTKWKKKSQFQIQISSSREHIRQIYESLNLLSPPSPYVNRQMVHAICEPCTLSFLAKSHDQNWTIFIWYFEYHYFWTFLTASSSVLCYLFFTSLFSISYLSVHSQQTTAAAAHISARFEWIAIKCKKTAAYDENLNMKKFFVSILSQSCDDNEIYVLYSAGIAVVYMHKVAD